MRWGVTSVIEGPFSKVFLFLRTSARRIFGPLALQNSGFVQVGLGISPSKSCFLIFVNATSDPHTCYCGGQLLNNQETLKFLGVTVSSSLGIESTLTALHQKQQAAWAIMRQHFNFKFLLVLP